MKECNKRMTIEELEQLRLPTISIQIVASIMKVTPRFLQMGLQQGRFPFGEAVKMKRWSYYINTEKFIKYMKV